MEYWKDGQNNHPQSPIFRYSIIPSFSIPFYWLCGLCVTLRFNSFSSSERRKRLHRNFHLGYFEYIFLGEDFRRPMKEVGNGSQVKGSGHQ
jgi:hypothetical protein